MRLLNLGSEEGIVLSFVIAHLEVNVPKSKGITRTRGPCMTLDALRVDSGIELSLPQLPKLVISASDISICDSSDHIKSKSKRLLEQTQRRVYNSAALVLGRSSGVENFFTGRASPNGRAQKQPPRLYIKIRLESRHP